MSIKRSLLVLILLLHFLSEESRGQAFDKGRVVISAGYGVPNLISIPFRIAYKLVDYTDVSFSALGPVLARAEYGLSKKIGVGLSGGYSTMEVGYIYKDWDIYKGQKIDYHAKVKWSSPSLGARLNFHFGKSEKTDPYFGFGGGWSGNKLSYTDDSPWEDKYPKPGISSFYFSIGFGVRYYFTNNIGCYTEVGWDKASLVQGGIVVKF